MELEDYYDQYLLHDKLEDIIYTNDANYFHNIPIEQPEYDINPATDSQITKKKTQRRQKVKVPEYLKDAKYYKYRMKNTAAARKSRAKKKLLTRPSSPQPPIKVKGSISQQIKYNIYKLKELNAENVQLKLSCIELERIKSNLIHQIISQT